MPNTSSTTTRSTQGSRPAPASPTVEADENGNPAGNLDLEKAILRNHDTMRAYYALIGAGRFGVLTKFGGEVIPVKSTSYGGLTKKDEPGYWNSGQTWIGNIEATEAAVLSCDSSHGSPGNPRAKNTLPT